MKEKAFTLVELMVVVAILGILAKLSISNYDKNKHKAMQAEAKLALASIYHLEKAFYSEYSAYLPAFDGIGFEAGVSNTTKYFYTKESCGNPGVPWAGTITGYSGPSAAQATGVANMPWPFTAAGSVPGSNCNVPNCNTLGNDPQVFKASSRGTLYQNAYEDDWTMDNYKALLNCSNGT